MRPLVAHGGGELQATSRYRPKLSGILSDGVLAGLDVEEWPARRRRFLPDPKPGTRTLVVDLGVPRGVQAVRNGAPKTVTHAEAYQRTFPTVGGDLR